MLLVECWLGGEEENIFPFFGLLLSVSKHRCVIHKTLFYVMGMIVATIHVVKFEYGRLCLQLARSNYVFDVVWEGCMENEPTQNRGQQNLS